MAAKPVMIGDRFYAKKSDAADACREVLYRYQVGDVVDDPEDEEFLHDLLDLHDDAAGKRGVGIDHFEIRVNDYRQPGFYIVRTDGNWTDFSFTKCLTPVDHRHRVLTALRRAVVDQVLAFKNASLSTEGTAVCAVTQEAITSEEIHIDHYDPDFNELAETYVRERGGWNAFEIAKGDGVIGALLVDGEQEQAWADYHRANAKLQVTSKIANLSHRRKGVKRPRRAL